MTIKIEAMRCFATVAELGNLADAANRLGRTQSALSMTLKQLEDHLGVRLFESERKNRLTPLGQEVLGLAQRQLRQFDETINAMETAASAPHGHLRIAAIPSAASLALPEAVATMAKGFPRISFDIRDMDTRLVLEALLDGQADIGLASGQSSSPGIHCETLFVDSFGLLCARHHPLAQTSENPDIREVLAHGFVRNNLCASIDSKDVQSALKTSKVTVHNTHTLLAMVRSGLWVTILPRTVADASPNELVFRNISGLDQQRTVSLLIRERTRFPSLVDEFAKILRKHDWFTTSTFAKDPAR